MDRMYNVHVWVLNNCLGIKSSSKFHVKIFPVVGATNGWNIAWNMTQLLLSHPLFPTFSYFNEVEKRYRVL